MEILWQDIRYALRMMAKSPGFVAAAVLTLALGIGANSAIFSMVNGVLLRALPYSHPEQIVSIYDVQPNYGNAPMSYPEYADWRDKVQVFQSVAAQRNGTFVLSGLGSPEQVRVICVSASYLPLLGVNPIIGRNILPEEEPFSGRRAAMISYSFWRTRLNSDPSVLTRALTLDDNVFPIVGVLPPDLPATGARRHHDRPLSFGQVYGAKRAALPEHLRAIAVWALAARGKTTIGSSCRTDDEGKVDHARRHDFQS